MLYYVVTEESTWQDPDLIRRGFNTPKGMVAGIYKSEHEAKERINDLLNCQLYEPYKNYAKYIENGVEIHKENELDLKIEMHLWRTDG